MLLLLLPLIQMLFCIVKAAATAAADAVCGCCCALVSFSIVSVATCMFHSICWIRFRFFFVVVLLLLFSYTYSILYAVLLFCCCRLAGAVFVDFLFFPYILWTIVFCMNTWMNNIRSLFSFRRCWKVIYDSRLLEWHIGCKVFVVVDIFNALKC